jgi:hypothetical protein
VDAFAVQGTLNSSFYFLGSYFVDFRGDVNTGRTGYYDVPLAYLTVTGVSLILLTGFILHRQGQQRPLAPRMGSRPHSLRAT